MKQSLLAILLLVSTSAFADQSCKPVTGHFEASVVPPGAPFPDGSGTCPSAILCTAGRVWGGIQGHYRFVMTSLQPTGAVPSIFFFTGNSTVTLDDGSIISGTDTGTIDLGPFGGFASLITFGTAGQIRLRGELANGTTSGDYTGTLCGQ
jgi:hypothetical protein